MHTRRQPRVVSLQEGPSILQSPYPYNSPPPPLLPQPSQPPLFHAFPTFPTLPAFPSSPTTYYQYLPPGGPPRRPAHSFSVSPRSPAARLGVVPCQGCCPSPRRTRAASTNTAGIQFRRTGSTSGGGGRREPWEKMTKAYTWVLEQEIAEMSRKNEEAVKFILKQQQEREKKEDTFFTTITIEQGCDRGCFVDELFSEDEEDPRLTRRWQERMEKLVQEEVRRLASKRKDAERCRRSHETRKTRDHVTRERERAHEERRTKPRREDVERRAWEMYESRWNRITSSSDSVESSLKFNAIPWPMVHQPKSVADLTPAQISAFLFSSHHSEGQSRKERVKAALRRWHPDRFGRVLQRLTEGERGKVEEGSGVVVRCLNDLLEREG
ncbi:hypothetical protein QCA50_009627 [Cerrena zonata]|uniref:Uncharacterized protein n=1 Tax=Cerrena zonata TaxID=2478898 RepID=A0AAW0G6Q7_9APHY